MYLKVLVPLGGSEEAEKVLGLVEQVLAPGGEVILLHVLPFFQPVKMGWPVEVGAHREEAERSKATAYLQGVAQRLGGSVGQRRCEVISAKSTAEGITDFATRERVDLIAMYAKDRKGLARLLRGDIAEKVQQKAPIEVQAFGSRDLAETASAEGSGENEMDMKRRILKEVDFLKGLTDEQIDKVAALTQRSSVAAGTMLGTAGELGECLFILIEGEAQLSAPSSVGEITVRIAEAGESFPLAALLGSGTLITSGKALTDMNLLEIPRSGLADLCSEEPAIGMRVYANIATAFVNRYGKTLAHLTMIEERTLENADFLANV